MKTHHAIVSGTGSFLLGLWVFLTPWTMGFNINLAISDTVAWSFWGLGAAIMISNVSSLVYLRPWKEWVNLSLGALLFVAPWTLSYSEMTYLVWNATIPAFAIIVASLIGLQAARRSALPLRPKQIHLLN